MKRVSPSLPFEYFVLNRARAAGPVSCVIGSLLIHEQVEDNLGHIYNFVGVARRDQNGRLDVGTLGPGEWIVEPDLIYRVAPN